MCHPQLWRNGSQSKSRTDEIGLPMAEALIGLVRHTKQAHVMPKAVLREAVRDQLEQMSEDGCQGATVLCKFGNRVFGKHLAGMLSAMLPKGTPVDYQAACKSHQLTNKQIRNPPEGTVPSFLKLHGVEKSDYWMKWMATDEFDQDPRKCYVQHEYGNQPWFTGLYTFVVSMHSSSNM
jgi:hypothetical protein